MSENDHNIKLSYFSPFFVGVFSSIVAAVYYQSLVNRNFNSVLILSLIVVLTVCLTALAQAILTLRKLKKAKEEKIRKGIAICDSESQKHFGSLLSEVQSEICFMGIIAKRTVTSDEFKAFLTARAGRPTRIKFLLLDPDSPIFNQRATDENESSTAWKQDLISTIHRLEHYRKTFNTHIEVRLYDTYPIWRTIILDKQKVVLNFFLKGRRGTESDQVILSNSEDHWTRAYIEQFDAIWEHHSREARIETSPSS